MVKDKTEEEEMKDVIAEIRADRKKRQQELVEKIRGGHAIYLVDQILGTLMERDGMTHEEAYEFFDFNIGCAYVGEYTPIYMYEE